MHNTFKTALVFFTLLCIQPSLCDIPTPMPTTNVYNSINPQIELHPQIYITNSSASSIKFGDITMNFIQKIKSVATPENYNLLKNNLKNMLWEYRYHIAGTTIAGTYTGVSALLLHDYYHIQQSTTWAHWKQNCSFECLCTTSQKDLTHELLLNINERYYNADKPTDFAHPLMMFIHAIETEIKTCKRYLNIAQTIKKLRLMAIFPTNDAKITKITQLLGRALFIKHLFLSWLAEYNISNNQKI